MIIKFGRLCMAMVVAATALSGCSGSENNEKSMSENQVNPAIENIMTRMSVRSYTDRTVSADTVEVLLRAAMAAPTAVNKQPWHFFVVRGEKVRNAIADSLEYGKHALREASVAIVVAGDSMRFLEGEEASGFWVEDCSAAAENLLLAAHSMGLGAVWCGVYPISERVNMLRKLLGAGDNIVPMCIIPVGYPSGENTPKDKWDAAKVTYLE